MLYFHQLIFNLCFGTVKWCPRDRLLVYMYKLKAGLTLCPSSKKGGYIALLLSVCLCVGRLVHQQFPFIFFTEVAHIEMKYRLIVRIIIISMSISIMGTIEQFLTELCPLNVEKFQLFAVSVFLCRGCTYWNEIWKPIQIYHNNIYVKFNFGYDRAIFNSNLLWT